mmetsp:Transcript_30870/g.43023  ORF Transcript_30870/g.43023 Transcript_30870/m.43023 type:complete len:351 (-) Transcript_30870:260-1312(-)
MEAQADEDKQPAPALGKPSTSSKSEDGTAPSSASEKKNIEKFLDSAFKGSRLSLREIKWICSKATKIFYEEPNIIDIPTPVTVVGDIHGQFHDLLQVFSKGGAAPKTRYVFLGDYVDRGHDSVEVMTLLLCLKVKYPSEVTLLRGNHECREISSHYGFFAECQSKFEEKEGLELYEAFSNVFDYLPLGALLGKKIFAVHAGLSPGIVSLDQIRVMERFGEVGQQNPSLQDLMWSDPTENHKGFFRSDRGNGHLFGEDVVDRFLKENKLSRLVRSHQLCKEGYQETFGGKVLTVWSAPNYCYRMENKASVLIIGESCQYKFSTFEASKENLNKASEIMRKEAEDEGPSSFA